MDITRTDWGECGCTGLMGISSRKWERERVDKPLSESERALSIGGVLPSVSLCAVAWPGGKLWYSRSSPSQSSQRQATASSALQLAN